MNSVPSSAPYDPVQQVFEKALKEFKAGLKDDKLYTKILQTTTIDQVYDATDKMQAEQAEKGHLRNLKKIEPFLEGLRNYASVIEVFMQAKPDIMALIWGPLKMLLQWASNLRQSFDAVVGALAEIGLLLPEFDATVQVFGSSANIRNILASFYKDILDFYGISLSFFRSSRRTLIFEAIWPRQKVKIEAIKSLIERHASQLRNNARLEDLMAEHEHRTSVLAAHERAETQNALAEFERIRTNIAPQGYEHKLYSCYSSTCAGTGRWLMADPSIGQWLDITDSTTRVIWLQGIPGAGKTILASSIVKKTSSDGTGKTLYAFLSDAERTATSALTILHSLIFQLASSQNLQALVRHCAREKLKTGLEDGVNLLKTMLDYAGPVYVVIDGVDEVSELERVRLLRELLGLVQSVPDLRLFISSRAEADIASELENKAAIIRVDDRNAGSIQTYVNSRITEWFDENLEFPFSAEAQEEIRSLLAPLAARSKGMFLYAKVVLNTIRYLDMPAIRGELEILPDSLDAAYARVLTRIEKLPHAAKHKALTLLGWIGSTRSPLTVLEMEQMLLIDAVSDEYNASSWRFTPLRIIAMCGPIVEILENQVHFVHFTVKEYLFKPRGGENHSYISDSNATLSLATCCITYMLQFHQDCFLLDEDIQQNIIHGAYRFHDYACTFWFELVVRFIRLQNEKAIPDCLLDLLYQLFSERANGGYKETDVSELGSANRLLESVRTLAPDLHESFCDITRQQRLFSKSDFSMHKDTAWTIRDPLTISEMSVRIHQQMDNVICRTTKHENSCHCENVTFHYGLRPFRCAFMNCPYRRLGFRDRQSRDIHMQHHDRPMRCNYPGCEYENGGFISRTMFEDHVSKFHGDETETKKKISGHLDPDEIQPLLFDLVEKDQTQAVRQLLLQYCSKMPSIWPKLIELATQSASMQMLGVVLEHPDASKALKHHHRWHKKIIAPVVRSGRLDNLRKVLDLRGELDARNKHYNIFFLAHTVKELILLESTEIVEHFLEICKADLDAWCEPFKNDLNRRTAQPSQRHFRCFTGKPVIGATANDPQKEILLLSLWEALGEYSIWDNQKQSGGALGHVADTTCSIRLAKYLVDRGAPLDFRSGAKSATPLQRAARRTSSFAADFVEFLLLNGADPHVDFQQTITRRMIRDGSFKDGDKPRKAIHEEAGAKNISKWLGVTWDELVERTRRAREERTASWINE